MDKSIDLENYHFECVRCGNCCYNVVRRVESNEYGYNFQGNFVLNPHTSVTIPFTEVPELKKNLSNHFNLELRLYPQYVLFLKEYQVGFIYNYQLGVKKKKFCRYYDIANRLCKIHSIRPSTCRAYPLTLNLDNTAFPTIEGTCTAVNEEIKRQFPSMKAGECFRFNNSGLIQAFFSEFLIYQITHEFLISQLRIIMSNLDFLFNTDTITSEIAGKYKLLDFSEFFDWCYTHIKDKGVLGKVYRAKSEIAKLQMETAQELMSWQNNPDTVHIPIRLHDPKGCQNSE